MKIILKLILAIYFLIGFAYAALIGICTHFFMEKAGVSNSFDKIDKLVYASRGESEVFFCVFGEFAETSEKINFSIRFDKKLLSKGADGKALWKHSNQIRVPRGAIHKGCALIDEDNTSEIHRISLTYPSGLLSASEAFDEFIKRTDSNFGFYEISIRDPETLEVKGSKDLLIYLGQGYEPGFLFIETGLAKLDGPNYWYFLVPIGLLGDALTYPLQIMAWMSYADSH